MVLLLRMMSCAVLCAPSVAPPSGVDSARLSTRLVITTVLTMIGTLKVRTVWPLAKESVPEELV